MESISFTFNYDKNSDQSLIKLWKLTNDKVLCTPLQSSKRLGNRSWRLISHRILHHSKADTSRKFSLADLDSSHSLSNLQDLKPSRPSLFSHTSNLSLYTRKRSTQTSLESASFAFTKQREENGSSCEILNVIQDEDESEDDNLSDVSDISEISEFSEEEEEEEEEDYEEDSNNDDDDEVTDNSKNNQQTSTENANATSQLDNKEHTESNNVTANNTLPKTPETRQGPPPASGNNIHRRSLDDRISPRNVNHKREPSMTKFYIANSPSPTQKKEIDDKANEKLSQQKSLDFSNGEQESRPTGRQGSLFNNFQFKEKSVQVNEDESEEYDDVEEDDDSYDSTDISEDDAELSEVEEDEEQHHDNELPQQQSSKNNSSSKENKASVSAANDNESDWLSVSTDSVQSNVPIVKNLKPQTQPMNFPKVDPSSSASLATIPIEISESQTNIASIKRPKSLLSNLFLNQLATTSTEPPIKHQSLSTSSIREKPTLQRSRTTGIITVDREVKRPSIIFTRKFPSVADINIPPLTPTDSNSVAPQTPLTKQRSIVGISDINVSIKPTEEKTWSEDGSVSASASLLSTSLSKMTRSSSHHSIKNLLSKSSLNITKIYHTNKPRHRDNNVFHKRNDELTKPDSSLGHLKHSPSSLTSASSILMVSQKSSSTPPPPVLPRVTTTEHEIQSDLLNTEELSKSLKDSILIDNKLGKIAMPEKVIDAGSFLRRESRLADSDDFDDYHAKGW
ncbi:hypothetical protein K6H09_005662 [Candida tropicalis]